MLVKLAAVLSIWQDQVLLTADDTSTKPFFVALLALRPLYFLSLVHSQGLLNCCNVTCWKFV